MSKITIHPISQGCRIVCEVVSENEQWFYPQYKTLFWWNYHFHNGPIAQFSSLKNAIEWLDTY